MIQEWTWLLMMLAEAEVFEDSSSDCSSTSPTGTTSSLPALSGPLWVFRSNRIKLDQIGSNWIRLDQIGSNWIKLDQIEKILKKLHGLEKKKTWSWQTWSWHGVTFILNISTRGLRLTLNLVNEKIGFLFCMTIQNCCKIELKNPENVECLSIK